MILVGAALRNGRHWRAGTGRGSTASPARCTGTGSSSGHGIRLEDTVNRAGAVVAGCAGDAATRCGRVRRSARIRRRAARVACGRRWLGPRAAGCALGGRRGAGARGGSVSSSSSSRRCSAACERVPPRPRRRGPHRRRPPGTGSGSRSSRRGGGARSGCISCSGRGGCSRRRGAVRRSGGSEGRGAAASALACLQHRCRRLQQAPRSRRHADAAGSAAGVDVHGRPATNRRAAQRRQRARGSC